jgi:RHS repeat-associated protein
VAIGATPFKVSFTETFTYAGRDGRVSQRVLTQATNDGAVSESFTQSWTYDVLGNVISLGYPDCTLAPCTSSPRTVSSTYTKGFLTGVTGFASSLTYHPNLQVNQVTNANGVVTTYAMDPNHMARPASIATTSATPWSSGAYAYDGAGNVTRIGNGRFLYDGVSRLLQGVTVTTPADSTTTRTQTLAYDLYGNIQSITTNGSTLNTPTNSANRLTSSGTAYDAAGNLITWNWGNTYQYDPFGLLWHYTSGAEDWLYMYTADDQRVWAYRTGGSGNYWAIRDLDGKVLREYSTHAGWTVDRDYVYRGDKLLAAVTPQGTRHFHLDHLGSVRQVTNASAAQVAFHAYYPFGREATTLGQDNKEQMQFTGHERDLQNTTAGTNSDADDLDYMHARYYKMHVGRFTSVDPARSWDPKAPQSWNRYGYATNRPLVLLDPDGRTVVGFSGFLNDPTGGIAQAIDLLTPSTKLVGQAGLFRHQDVDQGVDLILRRANSANPGSVVALFGHSLGARAALQAAHRLSQINGAPPVDLLVTVDPAPNQRGARIVPKNVSVAVNFYQPGSDLGGDLLTAADPLKTRVFNIEVGVGHSRIDEDVARAIVSFVTSLASKGTLDLKGGLQFIQGELVRVR